MKKGLIFILVVIVCLTLLVGCNDAEIIQHNISQQSDKFETYRKVEIINLRSDKVLLEIEGYLSIQNTEGNELAIVIKTNKDEYKMHYVYLAPEVVYLVEQQENTHTNPYHWDIRVHAVVPNVDTSN